MSGQLLYSPRMQFLDMLSKVLAGATAYFYLTDTTTPATVYQDVDLSDPFGASVPADALTGMFPTIFLDPTITYRMKVIIAGGDLANPLLDIDPIGGLLTITSDMLSAAVIEESLGYTPVDPAHAAFTSNVRLGGTLTALNANDAGFRAWQRTIKNADYTFEINDSQGLFVHDDTSTVAWTIPPHSDVAFPDGTRIKFANINTGVVTLTRGAGVTLRISGSGTSADPALAEWGSGELTQLEQDIWVAEGTELT